MHAIQTGIHWHRHYSFPCEHFTTARRHNNNVSNFSVININFAKDEKLAWHYRVAIHIQSLLFLNVLLPYVKAIVFCWSVSYVTMLRCWFRCVSVLNPPCHNRPDITVMVDWALQINYLSIHATKGVILREQHSLNACIPLCHRSHCNSPTFDQDVVVVVAFLSWTLRVTQYACALTRLYMYMYTCSPKGERIAWATVSN